MHSPDGWSFLLLDIIFWAVGRVQLIKVSLKYTERATSNDVNFLAGDETRFYLLTCAEIIINCM
jgi:hypothetical protein